MKICLLAGAKKANYLPSIQVHIAFLSGVKSNCTAGRITFLLVFFVNPVAAYAD
jgi:hypothetical protein